MTFVYPILLGGLLLAGVPVLLHFLVRQKPRTLPFPAFRFLMQKQRTNTRNLRLRHLLLLLLRVALIVLLCLALARPRLFSEQIGISREQPLALVLVFDTSPSMGYKHSDVTRLDLAKKRCLELLDQLQENCRVLVVDSAEPGAPAEWMQSLAKARQKIANLAIRDNNGPVSAALEHALDRIEEWERQDDPAALRYPRLLCVFSDRTTASWEPGRAQAITKKLERETYVKQQALLFDVGIDAPSDLAILHAELPRTPEGEMVQAFPQKAKIPLRVTVKATGRDVEAALVCKVAEHETRQGFQIKAGEEQTLTLLLDTESWKLVRGFYQATVRFEREADELAFNDQRFVTFKIREQSPILVLTDDPTKAKLFPAALGAWLYESTVQSGQAKGDLGLEKYDAVFLDGVAAPSEELWQALADYVRKGGGVGIIPGGSELQPSAYNSEAAQKIMPAKMLEAKTSVLPFGSQWDPSDDDLQRPFLRPYRKWLEYEAGDLQRLPRSATQYWTVEPHDKENIVVKYNDDDPAIVQRVLDKGGKVVLLTTPMEEQKPAWNDYDKSKSSFYVALTGLCARYLSKSAPNPSLNHSFGQPMPALQQPELFARYVLSGPDFSEEVRFDKDGRYRPEGLLKAGNYVLAGANAEKQELKKLDRFSVNIPAGESDLSKVPVANIEAVLGAGKVIPQDRHVPLLQTIEPFWDEPVDLFPWLMVLLLFLLAVENLLSNRFYRSDAAEAPHAMIFAELSWSLEPAWPWSIPKIGLPGMLAIALVLTVLTVWTYLGVRKARGFRLFTILGLRLLALALAFSMMLRPSFAVMHPEGVEPSKLLVVFDDSESMNDDATRWDRVKSLWASRSVQRRLEELASEQKIEIVKYLAGAELHPGEPHGAAASKRTDIGVWLHQLWQQHGHEKRLRGIALISDGGDNGTRFSALEKARAWRGICPISTFGAGDPRQAKSVKDIALTDVRVNPSPVAVKDKLTIRAFVQAPGFENAEVKVSATMTHVLDEKKEYPLQEIPKFRLKPSQDAKKELKIDLSGFAPEEPGEYKVTVKIKPLAGEASDKNNDISTYVQVIKTKIHVLWVDRPRVYEPTLAMRALRTEPRFAVHYVQPPAEEKWDPLKKYKLNEHYDVIVVGDLSVQQFTGGKTKELFQKIQDMVKAGTGLLMLGGTETFAQGGWDKQPAWLAMMPVQFDPQAKRLKDARVVPAKGLREIPPFLQLLPAPENEKLWSERFGPLDELTPLGDLQNGGSALAYDKDGKGRHLLMADGAYSRGRVVVFAGESTWQSWVKPDTAGLHARFWKQLVLYLANEKDAANPLVVELDRRRISAGSADVLGFGVKLFGKSGADRTKGAQFKAEVIGPSEQKTALPPFTYDGVQARNAFKGAEEKGVYKLVVTGSGKDADGSPINPAEPTIVRFQADAQELEKLRATPDFELLSKLAAVSEGRFAPLDEAALLSYLDELKSQVNSEARMKMTRWPDWNRLPASEHVRDQLAGVWSSFALGNLVLFVLLLGGEWLLRRWWGLV